VTANKKRLQDLGGFLRARRQQVDPVAKGFPVGRRRSPGLRREEVAVLASISPSWYTYLEQGRDVRPSEEVLENLAAVLDLNPAERRYLQLLALGRAPHRDQPLGGEAKSAIQRLLDSIDPIPAYAGDKRADVVAWNASCAQWLVDFGAMAPEDRNSMLWMIGDTDARSRLVDWEGEVREIFGRFRAATANDPDDPRIQQLIKHIERAPADVLHWWNLHEVRELTWRRRAVCHPVHGLREFQMVVLLVAGADNIGVILHLPLEE
jgi:transcriptional regulator with XRE-family HTH domain